MNTELRTQLIEIAKEKIPNNDLSHDFGHARRVLKNAERILGNEGWDLDIVVPAALFHDLVVYPKNHPESNQSQEKSAEVAEKILNTLDYYPKDKIEKVITCIMECSFSKGIMPDLLESKILQDADGLEATGAISIMRTYSSTGQVKRPFYSPEDPFCENREPNPSKFALDLFYKRLLVVADRMHTKTAKQIAKRRTDFLNVFLEEIEREIKG